MVLSIVIISTILLFIFISLNLLVVQRAYNEIETRNDIFYTEQASLFSNFFKAQLDSIQRISTDISIDKKIRYNEIQSNVWYRMEAIKYLKGCLSSLSTIDSIFFHFENSEHILTSSCAYSINRFLDVFSLDDKTILEELTGMLMNNHNKKISIISTFGKSSCNEGILYISMPLSIETYTKQDAIIIYSLSHDSISASFLGLLNQSFYGLAIFDSENIIYSNGVYNLEAIDDMNDGAFLTFLKNKDQHIYTCYIDTLKLKMFKYDDEGTGYSFLTLIPEDVMSANMSTFRNYMQRIIVIISLFLLLLLILSIYFNYRPILDLTRRLGINIKCRGEELHVLGTTFEQIRDKNIKMTEQHSTLIEFIIGTLISGKQNNITVNAFGDIFDNKIFYAISIHGLILDNRSRSKLVNLVKSKLKITMYITDILYEDHMTFVIALDPKNMAKFATDEIIKIIGVFSEGQLITGVGRVVDNVYDIKLSYLDSLLELNNKLKACTTNKIQKEVVKYVDDNATDSDLTMTKAADHFNMSTYSFSRLFKEVTGVNFKEYVSVKRYEYAKEILISTEKSVNQISAEVGFESPTYFMTWFKSMSGETPTGFRNK